MTNIELRNETGKIIGYDGNGNKIPIPLESLSTEEGCIGKSITLARGGDLDTGISTALSNGYHQIHVRPRADGTNWTWGSDLTLNPTNYPQGFEIQLADAAIVEYRGSGWMLTINSAGDIGSQLAGKTARVAGGVWKATGADPAGCIRLQDTYNAIIEPRNIFGYSNSTGDAAGIRIENQSKWSEANYIGGRTAHCDIGLDSAPASVTGGTGTESLQDNYVSHFIVDNAKSIGMRLRGNWGEAHIDSPTVLLGADGAIGYDLNGDLACTMTSPACEHSDTQSNTTAFRTGSNYGQPVKIMGGAINTEVTTHFDRAQSTDVILHIGANNNGFWIENWGVKRFMWDANGNISEMGIFSTGSPIPFFNGVRYQAQEEPNTPPSGGVAYVDETDGSLKVKFSNGTIKTIATNT